MRTKLTVLMFSRWERLEMYALNIILTVLGPDNSIQ
jgi:hypothetical protein